jgi:hypothetical protein
VYQVYQKLRCFWRIKFLGLSTVSEDDKKLGLLSYQISGTEHSFLFGVFVVPNVWDKKHSFVRSFCRNKCMGQSHKQRLGPLLFFSCSTSLTTRDVYSVYSFSLYSAQFLRNYEVITIEIQLKKISLPLVKCL